MQENALDRSGLITPEEITAWVSGKVLSESPPGGWKEVKQRTYFFHGQEVDLPPMDSFKIVQYLQGTTPMDRRIDGRWTRTECGPGHFSLLSRATETEWNWTEGLVVSHVYLSDGLMHRVAQDVHDGKVSQVQLHDVLRAVDPLITYLMEQIANEARSDGPGGPLYVESLSVQLAVHLLRKYAGFVAPTSELHYRLTQRQLNILEEYIAANLQDPISLEDLATLFQMGSWTFSRRVKLALGKSACALVQERRIERAKTLLSKSRGMPIKEIAAACGFSDQAHLTRVFRAKFNITPARYRLQL